MIRSLLNKLFKSKKNDRARPAPYRKTVVSEYPGFPTAPLPRPRRRGPRTYAVKMIDRAAAMQKLGQRWFPAFDTAMMAGATATQVARSGIDLSDTAMAHGLSMESDAVGMGWATRPR